MQWRGKILIECGKKVIKAAYYGNNILVQWIRKLVIYRLEILKSRIIYNVFIVLLQKSVIFETSFWEESNKTQKLINKDKHLPVHGVWSRPKCYELFIFLFNFNANQRFKAFILMSFIMCSYWNTYF